MKILVDWKDTPGMCKITRNNRELECNIALIYNLLFSEEKINNSMNIESKSTQRGAIKAMSVMTKVAKKAHAARRSKAVAKRNHSSL